MTEGKRLSAEVWVAISTIGAALITGAVLLLTHFTPPAKQPDDKVQPPPATGTTEVPVCVDNRSGCLLDRAQALFATAEKLDHDGRRKDAQGALVDAVQLYDKLLRLNPEQNGPPLAPAVIRALDRIGVDFSVAETELRQWLADPGTSYPAISQALLLPGWRLKAPVYLDVIFWNYEHTPGATLTGNVADVMPDVLKAAVVQGSNVRHGTQVAVFEQLLQP